MSRNYGMFAATLFLFGSTTFYAFSQEAAFSERPPRYGTDTTKKCYGEPEADSANCYTGTIVFDSLRVEIFRREQQSAAANLRAIEQLSARIQEQIDATKALDKTIEDTSKKQYDEFLKMFAAQLMARLDTIPMELARDETAYKELKAKLIRDVGDAFGLTPISAD